MIYPLLINQRLNLETPLLNIEILQKDIRKDKILPIPAVITDYKKQFEGLFKRLFVIRQKNKVKSFKTLIIAITTTIKFEYPKSMNFSKLLIQWEQINKD